MNNQKKVNAAAVLCLGLLLLPGCFNNNKVINWAEGNFKQADQYAKVYFDIVKEYFRVSSGYNFFTSVGDFTALCLTGDVRKAYADYYAHRHGLDLSEKKILLYRMLDENKHFVSFYVAGNQPVSNYSTTRAFFNGQYSKPSTLLGVKDAAWNIVLKVGDQEYKPHHVKLKRLNPEYVYFFGDKLSQFKKTYEVNFQVELDYQPGDVTLLFRSPEHEIPLVWKDLVYGLSVDEDV